jgi:D-glycero-D-manno-heptose 1,7-bisphosphate phosphatase
MARRFVLLDRDGTLNVERHYLADPEQVELLPGVIPGLRLLQTHDLGLVVLTNQSGLARGYFDRAALAAVHARLRHLLAEAGIDLAAIHVCPHGPDDGCTCRKPAPGLALAAAAEHGFDLAQSFVIGDKGSDVELGRAVGATTILVRTGYGEHALQAGVTADHVAADLLDAAHWIADKL